MQFLNTQIINVKKITRLFALFGILAVGLVGSAAAQENDFRPAPELPPACSVIEVPQGNKMFLRVYAVGVQIYRWNGGSWDFVAPIANLYADEDFHGQIGIHYAGPTWEARGGSKVVAARANGCQPDATAIPWLLLQTVSTERPGIFRRVSYIQRVNTAGGLTPALPGSTVGEEKRVPYTAEYYFYRPQH